MLIFWAYRHFMYRKASTDATATQPQSASSSKVMQQQLVQNCVQKRVFHV